jgi:cytochrome c2
MSDENKVEYIATDNKRQVIPWVKITNRKGEVKVYKSDEVPKAADLANGEHRTMDCIDCHNRPAHIYLPPFRTLNDAMAQKRIPATLPNIRNVASFALTQEYTTQDQAKNQIQSFIHNYYESETPNVAKKQATEIDETIREVQRIYERNFFPEMKVRWKEYPNNIGHMYSEGCFRCHDNKHRAADGTVLSGECNTCHLIVAQGPQGKEQSNIRGLPFIHPVNIDGAERTEKCTTCHNGE